MTMTADAVTTPEHIRKIRNATRDAYDCQKLRIQMRIRSTDKHRGDGAPPIELDDDDRKANLRRSELLE